MSDMRGRLHALALAFVDGIVEVVESQSSNDWVDQAHSPLGRRRHLELVRTGVLPAKRDKRRVLVLKKDIDAFLAGRSVVRANPEADEEREIARVVAALGRQGRRA